MSLLDDAKEIGSAGINFIGDTISSIGDKFGASFDSISDPLSSGPAQGGGEKYAAYPIDLGEAPTSYLKYDKGNNTITDAHDVSRDRNMVKNKPYIMFRFLSIVEPEVEAPISNNDISPQQDDLDPEGASMAGAVHNDYQFGKASGKKPDKQKIEGVVALYMTPSISVSDSVNYDEKSRTLMAGWDQFDWDKDNFGLSGEDMSALAAEHAEWIGAGAGAGIASAAEKVPGIGKYLGGSLSKILGAGAVGTIAGAAGNEFLFNRGLAANPNQYMQYKSTNLRTFEYSFKMMPNSATESIACKNIIKQFRTSLHAKKKSALTLHAPEQVVITYHGAENMPLIPPLNLTAVNITYNPNSASFFKVDNAPVEIDLSITLQEIHPLYRDSVTGGF